MAPWGWLALFLVGVILLQVVLYRYFQGADENERPSTHGARADTDRNVGRPVMDARLGPDSENRASGNDADGVHCQHCGARNEQAAEYTYCRRCVQPLQ